MGLFRLLISDYCQMAKGLEIQDLFMYPKTLSQNHL